jgi:hypothetical protein
MLISLEGTRFPRGGMERKVIFTNVKKPTRRYTPAGSPYNRYFPQESRTFHYNQHTAKNQHCDLTQPFI